MRLLAAHVTPADEDAVRRLGSHHWVEITMSDGGADPGISGGLHKRGAVSHRRMSALPASTTIIYRTPVRHGFGDSRSIASAISCQVSPKRWFRIFLCAISARK